jgi:D-glycero-alpha-D-manno-heptose-7-phosphate kinase
MIVTRSPLRISLGGGGTDLPSYYEKYGGFLIAATINKHIYISLAETFNKKFLIKYSSFEETKTIDSLKHPLFREILKKFKIKTPLIITSHADIPAGTGMGSSGAFAVTLINALSIYTKKNFSKKKIAEIACDIEINTLKEPVGKQDQYTASYGGINSYEYTNNGKVIVKKLKISNLRTNDLKKKLVIFFTGYSRSSYKILNKQNDNTKKLDLKMLENLHMVKSFGYESKKIIEEGNLDDLGKIMHEHWIYKKKRSPNMTNNKIDQYYNFALKNGALGGKLIGAGGGGFLMFYSKDINYLEKKFKKFNLKKLDFDFNNSGAELVSTNRY